MNVQRQAAPGPIPRRQKSCFSLVGPQRGLCLERRLDTGAGFAGGAGDVSQMSEPTAKVVNYSFAYLLGIVSSRCSTAQLSKPASTEDLLVSLCLNCHGSQMMVANLSLHPTSRPPRSK